MCSHIECVGACLIEGDLYMNKLDRLEKQVKAIQKHKESGVHIIEGGYCYSCKGECRYMNNDNATKIIDDISVINIDIPHNGFANAPTSTLEKIANMKEGEADGAEKENQIKTR